MNLNMFFFKICAQFEVRKAPVSDFCKENNFKSKTGMLLLNVRRNFSSDHKVVKRLDRKNNFESVC